MKKKIMLMGMVLMALSGGTEIDAAPVYELSTVVVTAERTDTKELRTPAAVEVVTGERIEKSGATNLQEGLKFSTGVITSSQGPKGLAQGVMTAKAVIRGVEKGTLVLVDGVPMNQSGMYQLQDISPEMIEKVEIVRGGGAVLYGSEASGGVINIITKRKHDNHLKIGLGDFGQQNYVFSGQADKFGFSYSYNGLGEFNHMSHPDGGRPAGMYYNMSYGEHNYFQSRYNLTDNLFLTHSYGNSNSHYIYRYDGRSGKNKDAIGQDVFYGNNDHMVALHFDDDSFMGNIYYHKRELTTIKSKTKVPPYPEKKPTGVYNANVRVKENTLNQDRSIGMDFSKRWKTASGSIMFGAAFQRDMAHVIENTGRKKADNKYERNMYSLYGQWVQHLTKETQMDVNFRQTWVKKDKAGNKYNKFTPEVIFSHNVNDNEMVYAKVGRSFMMPTFKQLYGGGKIIASPGLKPQTGMHYELGYKANVGKGSWRVALFKYDIKDSLEAQVPKGEVEEIAYTNEDVRNKGIECEYRYVPNDRLSYYVGAVIQHPEKQERDKSGKVGAWHDYYGKLQLNGGITYITGKLTTAFHFSHLGKRIRDAKPYESFKSQWFTDLNFSYQANNDCRLFLNIDNVLDRQDIVSSSSSSFYTLGRNFMAGVDYKF